MLRLIVVLVVAAALLIAGGAGAGNPVLHGVVGPGFSIKLSDANDNSVKNLDSGTYTFQIEDKAEEHNFHLTGPGVNMATEVEQMTTVTWTVTLKEGH